MTLERRLQALLDLVETDRSTRCAAIADATRQRTGTLLAQAHADARRDVRDAFAEERQRAAERIAAARARLTTRRRLYEQQRAAVLLAAGLERLPETLRDRWRDAAARAAWVDAVVAAAVAALPRSAWRIAHPPGWPEPEGRALVARIDTLIERTPVLVGEPAIDAGLRIAAEGNVIDGTLAGLVADRTAIGARLLGLIEDIR